jgi:hypothetical protein
MLQRAALASGAVVAGALVTGAAATPAAAATGDPVLAGEQTDVGSSTVIFANGASGDYAHSGVVYTDTAFGSLADPNYGFAAIAGIALSDLGLTNGVVGVGKNLGVYGSGPDGVYGIGTSNGVVGTGSGAGSVGVQGNGGDQGVVGIGAKQGVNGSGAVGVIGTGTRGGVGVSANCPSGTGLRVTGRAAFSTSGIAKIAKGSNAVTVTLASVTSKSMVLATLQTADGVIGVAHAVPGKGKFTIALTGRATRLLRVAWFVLG